MNLPDFVDCALLMAREQHYLNGLPWKDAFQIVTSEPEGNRSYAINWIQAYNMEHAIEIVERLANLPNPRSHNSTGT